MHLYNTPKKQVEEIQPQKPPTVTVYTCGPTVYDYPHIGNWFTFIRYDLLVRALKASGLQPKWALNITDVGHLVSDADEGEDKLQKGARREGKSAQEIADFYSDYFVKGLRRLNFVKPDYLPRATQHIPEQIGLIKKLEEKGYAYIIDDGVYYDTGKFPQYAQFAHLKLNEQKEGARVEHNPQKRNPYDFALWKFSPKGQTRDMEWDSPWGKGFPGWHLECSAMIHRYFGNTVDIHGGGIDHIPVHHTNEIAQSQATTGMALAKYWFHANHILINDQKIAKSEGNGVTLEDIEAKGYNLQTLRLLVLQSHYRTQSTFSWDNLNSAKHTLKYIQDNFSWVYQSGITTDQPYSGLAEKFLKFKKQILDALANDLDTPKAIALLNEYSDGFAVTPASQLDISVVEDFATFINDSLGISILDKSRYALPIELGDLIKEREIARKNEDWDEADRLKNELHDKGLVLLKDTEHGPIWYRK